MEHLLTGASVVAQSERQLLDRFVVQRDELAFRAIVARHGPMVVGVCRSILDQSTDVDDAFQATFLVLVRRAGTLRDGDQLSPWLHGVARRVALRARGITARRRGREISHPDLVDHAADRPGRSAEARELAVLLHAEIDRLNLAERSAILLCDLQGMTHQEAADQLGWPLGTVKTRVTRGRERLRARLARRGVTLGAAALGSVLAAETLASAVIPQSLIVITSRAALAVVAGQTLAIGLVSAPVLSLTQGVVRAMIVPKLTALALAVAATTTVLAVPAVVAYQAQQSKSAAGTGRPDTKLEIPAGASQPERVFISKKADGSSIRFLGTEPTSTDLQNLAILRKLEEPSPLGPLAQVQLKMGGQVAKFKGLVKMIQDASVDVEAGLPDGIPVEFTFAGGQLADAGTIEFAALSQEDRATPLREVLTREAKAIGLAYRVSKGELLFDFDTDPAPVTAGGLTMDRVRARATDDKSRNEAIQAKLDQVIPLRFPQGISLEEFVTAIKQATRSPEGKMIPIYVDPNAGKPLVTQEGSGGGGAGFGVGFDNASSIVIDLDDVPLRTSLRLALRQVQLDYDVAGGVLIIGNMLNIKRLSQLSAPFAAPGNFGGGMGGMGGMM